MDVVRAHPTARQAKDKGLAMTSRRGTRALLGVGVAVVMVSWGAVPAGAQVPIEVPDAPGPLGGDDDEASPDEEASPEEEAPSPTERATEVAPTREPAAPAPDPEPPPPEPDPDPAVQSAAEEPGPGAVQRRAPTRGSAWGPRLQPLRGPGPEVDDGGPDDAPVRAPQVAAPGMAVAAPEEGEEEPAEAPARDTEGSDVAAPPRPDRLAVSGSASEPGGAHSAAPELALLTLLAVALAWNDRRQRVRAG